MKKILLATGLLALATGCGEKQIERPFVPSESAIRFVDRGAAASRTIVEADDTKISIAWASGDAIGIFGRGAATGDNYPYAAAPLRDEPTQCSFAAMTLDKIYSWSKGEQEFYAYYPYDEEAEGEPNAWPLVLPTQQTQQGAGSMEHLAALGVMKAAPVRCRFTEEEPAPVEFAFRSIFAIVELRLKMDASSAVDVPIRRIRLLSGTTPLTIAEGTIDLTAPADSDPIGIVDGKQEAVLVFGTRPVLNRSAYENFYLTVAPGEHPEGLTLEVTAIDNSTLTMALPATAFKANSNYRQDATLLLDDFVPAEPFSATTAATECKAGEPFVFALSGEAETVDFYSGEMFHQWEYAKKDRMDYSDVFFSFRAQMQTVAGKQLHPLSVKVSTDFDGTFEEANILAATWTDISARFTLPTKPWTEDNGPTKEDRYLQEDRMISSGEVNLGPWYDEKSPYLYVAFFYHIDKYDASLGNERTGVWFTDIQAVRQEGDTQTLILKQTTDDIHIVKGNSTSDWGATFNHNGVTFYPWRFWCAAKPANNIDAYAVTNRLERKVSNFGPDKPESVKSADGQMPQNFSYVFAEPGTYEVVLVGRSKTLTDETEVVCTFNVTVKP